MKGIALAGLAIAALTFAPHAAADLPGIDAFTGPPASVSGNNGVALEVSMGRMRDWDYCNDTTHNYCGG